MDKAVIEILQEYLEKNCDYIKNLKIDYLNEDKSWSLEQGANPMLLKKNVLGNRKMQLSFTLASRVNVNSITDSNQKQILKAFSDISEWMYQKTREGLDIKLNSGEYAESLGATQSAYLFAVNKDRTQARYEMPCLFVYKKLKESENNE